MSRILAMVATVLGLWISGAAFAQTEPGLEPLFEVNNPWRRIDYQVSTILQSLHLVHQPAVQMAADLTATNTLIETTNSDLVDARVTTQALEAAMSDTLTPGIQALDISLDAFVDECDDAVFSCSGSKRTIAVDGLTSTFSCYPYTCENLKTCRSSCTTNDHCSGGTHCDRGSCVRNGEPKCDYVPGHQGQAEYLSVVVDGAGNKSDCYPLVCADGACITGCLSAGDCMAGFVCDTAHYLCVVPGTQNNEED